MLKLFRKDSLTPQTERIYKVPLCIQDTIPIYRISENGIFELESPTNKDGGKKKIHQFDRMYLFEDINFSTQDDEEKEETMKGLNSAVGYIRRELAHSINLRNTPEITFILDDSIEYGVNMSKKIDELNHGSENETL